mgnify:CR=1 FL=1
MKSGKHTAIYIRVSTTGQDHASQLPDLERWAEASGDEARWYRDKFTGRTMDRPQMTKMLDDLNAGKLARIVVWRLDRLGRTARGLCQLFDDLHARKVDLVSLKDGFSLESPAGRLHARILASVAEYETEVRAERVRAGQAAAKAKGKRWGGRPKGPNKKTKDKRTAILKLHHGGMSIVQIAKTTGLSRPTIYRVVGSG